jgi:hypothetical protein
MKNTQPILDIKPVIISGIKKETLFYNSVLLPDRKMMITLYKEFARDSIRAISSNVFGEDIMKHCRNAEEIESTLIQCFFINIDCVICHNKVSAINICESEIGRICQYCWSDLNPPIQFKSIDGLENFLENIYTQR